MSAFELPATHEIAGWTHEASTQVTVLVAPMSAYPAQYFWVVAIEVGLDLPAFAEQWLRASGGTGVGLGVGDGLALGDAVAASVGGGVGSELGDGLALGLAVAVVTAAAAAADGTGVELPQAARTRVRATASPAIRRPGPIRWNCSETIAPPDSDAE